MAHIGVKRLAAGDRERHGTKHQKASHRRRTEDPEGVHRVQRRQHARGFGDLDQPVDPDHREPHQHDRAEEPADALGTALLKDEQHHQHDNCERQDEPAQRRGADADPFDRAQDGNCRCDYAVAVKQRGAADGEENENCACARASRCLLGERQQGQDPAFALIVRAHDQQNVFDGDDKDQRPHDQRQHAEHVFGRERQSALGVEALPKGVHRARPDIAEHDPERRNREPGETARDRRPLPIFGGRRCRVPSRDGLGRRRGAAGPVRHARFPLQFLFRSGRWSVPRPSVSAHHDGQVTTDSATCEFEHEPTDVLRSLAVFALPLCSQCRLSEHLALDNQNRVSGIISQANPSAARLRRAPRRSPRWTIPRSQLAHPGQK